MNDKTEITEISDNLVYMANPKWLCGINDKEICLGLTCEAIDLREIDSEYDKDPYPVVLECQIVVQPKDMDKEYIEHLDIDGIDLDKTPKKFAKYHILQASHYYSGGVCVNMESIKGSAECLDVDSEIRTIKNRLYGEIKTRRFRYIEDAIRYAKTVYSHNAIALFGLVGFYLDRTLNLVGTTGWDIVELQAFNKPYL